MRGFSSSRFGVLLLSLCLLDAGSSAGVTGVPFVNDYTINFTCGSGATSCSSCSYVSPVVMDFSVTTTPGLPVVFAFTFGPCAPDTMFLPPVLCPLPYTSFSATTNQSVDIGLASPLLTCTATTLATGAASCTFPVPMLSMPITLGTQAAVIGHPCAVPSLALMTQAHTLTIF